MILRQFENFWSDLDPNLFGYCSDLELNLNEHENQDPDPDTNRVG
jgi:hypothetical protein